MSKHKKSLDQRCAEMKARQTETPSAHAGPDGLPPMSVQQAARALGRSDDWTRDYFRQFPDVPKMPSLKSKRGIRPYITLMIPQTVFRREWDRLSKH